MSTPFLGQLMAVSFGFAPKGWALCNGQLLPINQDQALFALLGTMYGGDGRVNFALPNLQGRVPISTGNGHTQGEIGGEEVHTVTQQEMPQHVHLFNATSAAGTSPTPAGNVLASGPQYISGPGSSALVGGFMSSVGGSQPHTNLQPYLVINWCIALQGIFPTQN
jgi:microcystin-dependent protein